MGGEGYGVATGESLGARSCRQGLRKKNRRKKSEVILYSVMDSTTHASCGSWTMGVKKAGIEGACRPFLRVSYAVCVYESISGTVETQKFHKNSRTGITPVSFIKTLRR